MGKLLTSDHGHQPPMGSQTPSTCFSELSVYFSGGPFAFPTSLPLLPAARTFLGLFCTLTGSSFLHGGPTHISRDPASHAVPVP